MSNLEEILTCAECDGMSPIGHTRHGEDALFVYPDCGTIEGRTRAVFVGEDGVVRNFVLVGGGK